MVCRFHFISCCRNVVILQKKTVDLIKRRVFLFFFGMAYCPSFTNAIIYSISTVTSTVLYLSCIYVYRHCVTLHHILHLLVLLATFVAVVVVVDVDVYEKKNLYRLIINSTHVQNWYKYWQFEWGRMSIARRKRPTNIYIGKKNERTNDGNNM